MGYILSREQLNDARKRAVFFSVLNESINARERGANFGDVTVFLSHNHNDKNILENVIGELKTLGVNVYVDWNDKSMPFVTSGETAKRIKDKIKTAENSFYLRQKRQLHRSGVIGNLGMVMHVVSRMTLQSYR